ncbi:hypothetical protein HYH03_003435 [Edaphochlamys debaryana]|uniref:Uncharacterized protein n=1 Tax=Edaphochlamys debaryana TaxID=47281 RepID=A0A835YHC8_9CHLO|nr:hypothetical protein HYH03_003435 [Edaphochlamys debaryana]|eukprot:KAG2498695.1 hypothetical protein HYH03_003435 [Edaphochlamys debaryana]
MRPAALGPVALPALRHRVVTVKPQLPERVGQPGLGAPGMRWQATRPAVQTAAFFNREPAPPLDPSAPEQLALRASAGWQRSLSFVAFWLQLALTLVSAGILIFSLAATTTIGPVWPRYFTLGGIVFAFLSTFFAHGFQTLAKKLAGGEPVAPAWLARNLLANNTLNVLGIAVTVIGLQASVGTLVSKSLMTSVQAPFSATNAANALVSLDVFSLQAATNTLLSHLVSLVFTNMMLRVVSSARAAAPPPPAAVGGVEMSPDGLSPTTPIVG